MQKQSVVYTSSQNIKLKLKSLRIERMHTMVYTGFTLNQELHPVFPETTGELTKQSTLDYLQHHQRSDLDPLKTHTSFGFSTTPLRMLILTTSRTHNTSQLYTQFLSKYKGLHLEILYHTLFDPAISNQSLTLSKAKSVKNSNMFFFD